MKERNYEKAEWCNLRIIRMIEAQNLQEEYKLERLNSYLFLSKIAELTNRQELAEEYRKQVSLLRTPDAMIQLAIKQCNDALEDNDFNVAIMKATEWLELASVTKDYIQIAKVYHQLGIIESSNDNSNAATGYHLKACMQEVKTGMFLMT